MAVPLELDAELMRIAEARGISIQRALREAVEAWVRAGHEKGP